MPDTEQRLRQIDALVAKQVMEERVIDIPFIPNTVCPKTALFTDEAASEWRKVYPHSYPIKTIPRYSSDIAAAWQVAEKLRDGGYVVTFAIYPEGMDMKNGAVVGNYRNSLTWQKWDGYADTMPLAICIAALRAVGVEVPEDE